MTFILMSLLLKTIATVFQTDDRFSMGNYFGHKKYLRKKNVAAVF